METLAIAFMFIESCLALGLLTYKFGFEASQKVTDKDPTVRFSHMAPWADAMDSINFPL